MKIAFFSTNHFEKAYFEEANKAYAFDWVYFESSLNAKTVPLTKGFDGVCCFVSDQLNAETLEGLAQNEVRLIALRSAGYNHVDLEAADRLGLNVVRVPAYSPHAVAEHAAGLLLSLNRKIHKAYVRVRELNFSLEGLTGFELCGKTIGVIGTGRIGSVFAKIMNGFDCRVLAYDPVQNAELIEKSIVKYVSFEELVRQSDVISLHLPLFPETKHIIDAEVLSKSKAGMILINTGRGALIDSIALIAFLKSGHLGGAALDVYEEEEGIFFRDLSDQVLRDDVLARLLTFPNVLMTSHQAFLTKEALQAIAQTTLKNISDFRKGRKLENEVHASIHIAK